MKQEKTESLSPERSHTYRELCEAFFDIKFGVAAYSHTPVTQEVIDRLPPMVRLANEQKIKVLGLQPNITERLRSIAEHNNSFKRIISADVYDRVIKGSASRTELFPPTRYPHREK